MKEFKRFPEDGSASQVLYEQQLVPRDVLWGVRGSHVCASEYQRELVFAATGVARSGRPQARAAAGTVRRVAGDGGAAPTRPQQH